MRRFAKYAWGVLGYNLAVVLWGAYVRASGSGAGCGRHWPLCNGEVMPRSPHAAMLIELTHRATSGVALALVVGLFLWSRRADFRGSPVRLGAAAALAFMLTEALLGAGLVLFALVAHDASLARVFSLGAHLLNTFLLLGSIALTAWWASGGAPIRPRADDPAAWLLGLGMAGVLVVGASGAMTALGDTLFPSSSLSEGLRQDVSPTAHFLVRLRVLHPTLAIGTGLYLLIAAAVVARGSRSRHGVPLARALGALVLVQWIAGVANILLLAPTWLQLAHLVLADGLWVTLVLLAAAALAEPTPAPAAGPPEPLPVGAPARRVAAGGLTAIALLVLLVGGRAPAAAQALDPSRFDLVDLTHPFDAQTLYWPTAPSGFELKPLAFGKTAGGWFYSANTFSAPEHGGTHLDAPIHFSEAGLPADRIPLRQLIAPAVVIDISAQAAKDPDYRLTTADVLAFERKHGRIPAGAAVLLRTGWDARWPDRKAYFGDDTPGDASRLHFPSFGPEAARLLVEERKVGALGVDVASVDYGQSHDFMVHRIAAARNVVGYENLTHLDALPPTGTLLVALPMMIENGSGGPLRAVALVPHR
jgi:cytochrome c oxidase assembly protein subunit 15